MQFLSIRLLKDIILTTNSVQTESSRFTVFQLSVLCLYLCCAPLTRICCNCF
uniref:Uncharacterized protein n=1 Tax=Anguilla anguilla TaxID=7936 RepID=A0A0E9TPX1_ANGAN